ncbi:hypothetical protein CONCODRAFT_137126 [Conidiobolus coronatus NRRL 28638]|uniref:Uncharacterized protein n=1 Tax=Conidiobolus coronatus (strain ATCC 28846 / CBS 209.66 / NRRL 28638) TaxID=796925 RepID=A0A137PI91_CONC2|nr:hypothetical protein CONCODRAFT_137126 [Conidiobolus coronatus NRRL 28638]|eukprot:KXN74661.1 hypothetical protein CONCODRAFT_137126 [Conidiobolus coronatus NRRL 28638]
MADSGPPSRPDLPRMASPHPMDHPYGSGMPQDQRMRSMKPDPLAPMAHQASDGRKMSIPINMAGRHPNPPPHHNSSLPPPRGNPDYPPYPGQEPSHHHSRLGHPPPRGDFDEYSRGTPYSGRPHPHQEPGYPGEPNSAYPHHPIISDPRRPSTGGPRGVPPSHPGHEEYGHHSSMHLPDIRSMERQGKPPSSAPWAHSNAMGHGGEHHYNRSEVSPKSMMPPHRPPTRHIDDDYDRAVNALVSIRGQSGKMQPPPRRSPSAKPNDPHLKSHQNKPMSMGSNLSPATHSRHATPLPSRPGPYHSKPGNDGSEPPNLPPSQP